MLDAECEWLIANGVVSADAVRRNRRIAEAALRPWTPVFIHGDLQIVHVFVDGDEVSGVVDWSEGGQGDAMYDLATLTLAHEEHLDDVIAGYGGDVEIDVIRAVLVVAKSDVDPLAGRARVRRAGDVPRGCRTQRVVRPALAHRPLGGSERSRPWGGRRRRCSARRILSRWGDAGAGGSRA